MCGYEHFLLYDAEHHVYDYEHYFSSTAWITPTGQAMKHSDCILIVDDDDDILTAGRLLLKRHFAKVDTCNDPANIPALLAKHQYSAILLDMNFGPGESSGEQGYGWLQKILQIDPQAVVVMITAHGDMHTAVEAMKLGATDFIAKPWQNEKVVATLSSAVALSNTRNEAKQLRSTNKLLAEVSSQLTGQQILGQSTAMQEVMGLINLSAPTDANVLILGENGTGKELVARELHHRSQRTNNVFMSVDLGAVTETLFESELFGYKKGAFTGANEDRVGRIKAADGGTLFLDEIGNLPLHLQAKLLTALEQRRITPVGGNQSIPFDARVIAATNLTMQQLNDEQKFRQDLLFRLNTVEIHLPPLRQRVDDIQAIAEYYLAHYSKKYNKPVKPISNEALTAMQCYDWPGNIRALRHALERAVILSQSEILLPQDFQLANQTSAVEASTGALTANSPNTQDELNLEKIEKNTIQLALKRYNFNISHAAKALGLTRAALYRRMEKYGL